MTSAKALKKKHAWHVPGGVRRPIWQEQSEQGDKISELRGRGGMIVQDFIDHHKGFSFYCK